MAKRRGLRKILLGLAKKQTLSKAIQKKAKAIEFIDKIKDLSDINKDGKINQEDIPDILIKHFDEDGNSILDQRDWKLMSLKKKVQLVIGVTLGVFLVFYLIYNGLL